MRSALSDLALTTLDVVHAGAETYPLARNVRAVAASRLLDDIPPLATRAGRAPSRGRPPLE